MNQLFDYVISNPPYQKNIGGSTILNIYPAFINMGTIISKKSTMIHPARAFKGAGRVIKQDVDAILNNKHIQITEEYTNGAIIFPNTDIRGGVYITQYDYLKTFNKPLMNFYDSELTSIIEKVKNNKSFIPLSSIIYSYRDNKISEFFRQKFNEEITNAPNKSNLKTNILQTIPQLFSEENYIDEYLANLMNFASKCESYSSLSDLLTENLVFGFYKGQRNIRKITDESFIEISKDWQNKWKVFQPAANGSGIMGEKISQPFIGAPNTIATQTYIAFGMFDSYREAENCSRFLKTRFARALLFSLKTTQQNAKKTWDNIPLISFDEKNNSINWCSNSIHSIDCQLFEIYNLSYSERQWLMKNIKSMDS